MATSESPKSTFFQQLLRLLGLLVLATGIFAFGYYTGGKKEGEDPVESLKGQVQEVTSTVVEKSSELKRDLTLWRSLKKAKTLTIGAGEEIRQKNFGKAQTEVSEVIELLTEASAIPEAREGVEQKINSFRTRLLDVQDDANALKPTAKQKLDDIAEDMEQFIRDLRN